MTVVITDQERQALWERLVHGYPLFCFLAEGMMDDLQLREPFVHVLELCEEDEEAYVALNMLYELDIEFTEWKKFFKHNKDISIGEMMDELFWRGARLEEAPPRGYLGSRCQAAGYFFNLRDILGRQCKDDHFDRLKPSDTIDLQLMEAPEAPLLMALLKLKPDFVKDPFGSRWVNGLLGSYSEGLNVCWCLIAYLGIVLGFIAVLLGAQIASLSLGVLGLFLLMIGFPLLVLRWLLGRFLVGYSEGVIVWPGQELKTYGDLCRAMSDEHQLSGDIRLRRNSFSV